ncbi:MAG: endopeptidase La [Clostridiales bacterium]|nr:endopeptidase La [Clostridiales bacterium]
MSEMKKCFKKHLLPLLPLRGLTVFPNMILHFDVGRKKSVQALEEAVINDQLIFLVTQKDAKNEDPGPEDIYKIGTISKVKQLLKLPGDTIRVLVEGVCRAHISKIKQYEPFFMAELVERKVYDEMSFETEALRRKLISVFEEYAKFNSKISQDVLLSILLIEDNSELTDVISANLLLNIDEKQKILEEFVIKDRMELLIEIILKEIEIMDIEKDISIKVKKQMEKTQKEYYLREQMKAIQKELGDKDGILGEVAEYQEKMKERNLPEEVTKKVNKELDRLTKMLPGSAEGTVIRSYLDWVLDVPWDVETKEIVDIKRAENILNEDHYGLEKVKERVLEYLAVRELKKDLKGPILCLVGPPGVGKTSIAKSIAKALNKKYVRIALGGVKDEAEIRGHRRTYVGAMPGRIVTAIKQAGSMNPLVLLDEIDKMSSDYRGSPSWAMLEVLDGEQNNTFRDHFMELDIDLSKVMFVTTANSLETVDKPLLDRMEVVELSSYVEEEKIEIAQRYLFPKQILANGLEKYTIKYDKDVIRDIITYYTKEAGVRNLERSIARICRKIAKKIIETNQKTITISTTNLEKFLGKKIYRSDKIDLKNRVGVVRGLAWTPVGGDTLEVEVNIMPGKGNVELTGKLGDVMKESAKAAISCIRSRIDEFDIDKDFYSKYDIHIHVPEGAIPKDGPSAGVTIATSVLSALMNVPVKRTVAMTGEITLRGRVLPIGGLKEKVIAAYKAGITEVIIPLDNKKDIDDIPENIRKKIRFIMADNIDTVFKHALVRINYRNSLDIKNSIMGSETITIKPEETVLV